MKIEYYFVSVSKEMKAFFILPVVDSVVVGVVDSVVVDVVDSVVLGVVEAIIGINIKIEFDKFG